MALAPAQLHFWGTPKSEVNIRFSRTANKDSQAYQFPLFWALDLHDSVKRQDSLINVLFSKLRG